MAKVVQILQEILLLLLIISTTPGYCKLVLEAEREAELTSDMIRSEGDLLSTTTTNVTWRGGLICEGMKERRELYEYFVSNPDGSLESSTAEIVTGVVETSSITIRNSAKTWVAGTVAHHPELNCVEPDSEKLMIGLREHFLLPPSIEGYNETFNPKPSVTIDPSNTDKSYSQYGQDKFIDEHIFKGKLKNGFFVEAGAADGVEDSNTLMFEIKHGWSGLLVEGNPLQFALCNMTGRRAWQAPVCLALKDHAHFAQFSAKPTIEGGMAGLVPPTTTGETPEGDKYQCFPLYSLLLALDNPTVNLLVLDIEGAEYEVLKMLPWDKVDIEVLMVELEHVGKVFPGTRREVHLFLLEKGYEYVGSWFEDDFFVRKDLNTVERYGIAEDLYDLEDEGGLFIHIYDFKKEGIPSAKEWEAKISDLKPYLDFLHEPMSEEDLERLQKDVGPIYTGDSEDEVNEVKVEADSSESSMNSEKKNWRNYIQEGFKRGNK